MQRLHTVCDIHAADPDMYMVQFAFKVELVLPPRTMKLPLKMLQPSTWPRGLGVPSSYHVFGRLCH